MKLKKKALFSGFFVFYKYFFSKLGKVRIKMPAKSIQTALKHIKRIQAYKPFQKIINQVNQLYTG